jgi:hypothetical protein
MMRLATTLVCLALAAAAKGESLLEEDISPSEELEPEEVLAKLSRADRNWDGLEDINELVSRALLAAKDKNSKVNFADVTVAELISLHHIELEDCSKAAMKKRLEFFNRMFVKFSWARTEYGIEYAVTAYTALNLIRAAAYCLEHKHDFIAKKLFDEDFLKGMRSSVVADLLSMNY